MLEQKKQENNLTRPGKNRWWITLILSMLLAIGTWNPTDFHFINYLIYHDDLTSSFNPFIVILFIGLWLLAIKSITQSLNILGILAILLVFGAFIYGLNQYQLFDWTNFESLGWAGTISTGLLVWIGLNIAQFWKRLTGVYSVEDIND